MTSIYIVFGSTGEYSDHREWPVAAFLDESEAKEHVRRASLIAEALYKERKESNPGFSYEMSGSPYDPNIEMDYYGGALYSYWTVPLLSRSKAFEAE